MLILTRINCIQLNIEMQLKYEISATFKVAKSNFVFAGC